ncbi:hypothetical protein [Marinibactrum halimedae]|uniref:hypothetical protein n=1 Tax=Marinibactrum halimedae TaxID=1444977 RepID=UPI001E627D68|nr:hypothetical protein [Marinibactrum halimedae]MCD9460163.1 hypothetical protein [Marinibactrum halimedae]
MKISSNDDGLGMSQKNNKDNRVSTHMAGRCWRCVWSVFGILLLLVSPWLYADESKPTLTTPPALESSSSEREENRIKFQQFYEKRFSDVDVVEQVLVREAKELVDVSLSRSGVYASSGTNYHLFPELIWKGNQEQHFWLEVPYTSCDKSLVKNSRYVIFASYNSSNALVVENCQDILTMGQAAQLFSGIVVSSEESNSDTVNSDNTPVVN